MSAPAAAGPGPAMAHLRWEERNQALQTSILEDRALGAFSDTTIRCRDQTVRAHKLVLAASSSFLADILRGCAEAAAEEECVLLLPDLEAAALASLLEAVYSGARLDRWSLASEPVLAAAETLGMLGTEASEQFSVSLGLDTLELYTGSFSGTKVFILNNFSGTTVSITHCYCILFLALMHTKVTNLWTILSLKHFTRCGGQQILNQLLDNSQNH